MDRIVRSRGCRRQKGWFPHEEKQCRHPKISACCLTREFALQLGIFCLEKMLWKLKQNYLLRMVYKVWNIIYTVINRLWLATYRVLCKSWYAGRGKKNKIRIKSTVDCSVYKQHANPGYSKRFYPRHKIFLKIDSIHRITGHLYTKGRSGVHLYRCDPPPV